MVGILTITDWNKMRKGPLKVIVENPRIELYKIDFPAVTVCSRIKVRKSKLDKLIAREFDNFSNESSLKDIEASVLALSLLGYLSYNTGHKYIKHTNTTPYILNNDDIPYILEEVGPSIDDMLGECYWRGNRYNCSELFRRQHTESGFCYSFNSKTAIRDNTSSIITPPFMNDDGSLTGLRSNSAGKITGLELFFQKPEDEFISVDRPGYTVIVHHPSDYPPVINEFQVKEGIDTVIRFAVSVEKTDADNSLYELDEDARGCHLGKSIHTTTEANCYLQCRLKYIRNICNCTPYFFTEFLRFDQITDQNSVVCGIQHLICLDKVNRQLKAIEVTEEIPGFPEWSIPPSIPCSCVPSCTEVSYSNKIRIDQRENRILNVTYAYLDIFYMEEYAIGYTRQATLTFQDFLVGIGGVGGWYLGCSLISVMEIVCIFCQFVSDKFYYKQRYVKKKVEQC